MTNQAAPPPLLYSPRDHATTLALCVTLGSFGAHRLYAGRFVTGTLQLLSSLACLAAGIIYGWQAFTTKHYIVAVGFILAMMVAIAIWPLVDFWLLHKGTFRDGDGLPLAPR
ncbi:TM2 domain-containing protein [Ruficoccus amylovorans]|uniref:TM2 domain-containing protein n=1 Tax=Ruficoccus amylovorans TaxID=1804625 RepID=A0A842HBU7_9BACT|nr:TM2 domain-containing protein [Ruficoccus amylovorans]MBC2593639.1 TM2 domain-containing protein [Ruficoccus amylovorans]